MSEGPSCSTCGGPLRWFPDVQKWGCDRCRIVFPAQIGQVHAPRTRMRWGVVLGLLVVVGGGVMAAVLVLGRASPPPASPRDELVHLTFASLAAGDHGGLVSRSGLGNVMANVTCDNGEMPDVSKDLSDFSEQVDRAIGRAQGSTFEIEAIDEPEPAKRLAKGDELAKGCRLEAEMVTHVLAVKVKITRGTETSEATAKLTVVELKGKWYAMSPPRIADGCDGAVARIAVVGGRDAKDPDLATKLQPALIAQCETERWSDAVVACLTKAADLPGIRTCDQQLTADQQAKLGAALAPSLAGAPAASALRDLVPAAAAPVVATAPPAVVTLGTPVPAPIGDLWVWPRSDGKFLVASPDAEVVFPHEPKFTIVPAAIKRGDGSTIEDFQITDTSGGTTLQVELMALGYGLGDAGVTRNLDSLRQAVAKVGKVTESKRDDHGVTVHGFAATDATHSTLRVEQRTDRARGFSLSGTAVTGAANTAVGDEFLASIHLRHAPDPALDGVRVRKAGRKHVVHDGTESFSIELPWPATVKGVEVPDGHHVGVVIAAKARGKGEIRVVVDEFGSWDGLELGPTGLAEAAARLQRGLHDDYKLAVQLHATTLAGQPATRFDGPKASRKKFQAWSVWNRFQHRTYEILCVDAPGCGAVAKSLRFADPVPPEN
jgi:hypothetical protein